MSAPRADGGRADSGLVQVFPVTDLDAETTWSQDSTGVPGGVDAGDRLQRRPSSAGKPNAP